MDASSLDMVVVAFPSFSKKRIYEFRLVLVTFSTSVIPLSSRKDFKLHQISLVGNFRVPGGLFHIPQVAHKAFLYRRHIAIFP